MRCSRAALSVVVMLATTVLLAALLVPALSDRGASTSPSSNSTSRTDRPIIGILSQELSQTIQKYYGQHDSYIAASYVKFIEGAGARAAPIFIGRPAAYYREMVQSVNGVLLPGGATYFDSPNGYGAAGIALYEEVMRINGLGDYVPLMGICLGMELIAVAAAGGISRDPRAACQAHKSLSTLTFLPSKYHTMTSSCLSALGDMNEMQFAIDYGTVDSTDTHEVNLSVLDFNASRLFRDASEEIESTLRYDAVLVNEHGYCVTPENFTLFGLKDNYDILSTSRDNNNLTFVSTFESKQMPIYGIQFHPEKHSYEWKRSKKYPHTPEAIQVGRYFADFLVAEARKNNHTFNKSEEREHLIYHYTATDTGTHLAYEQLYFFTNKNASDVETVTVA